MARGGLTPKQQCFVLEYLVDFNATQAAVRAGYSQHTAGSVGFEILKKPEIQAALAEAQQARAARTGITADRVLEEIAKLAFSDKAHYRMNDAGQVVETEDAPPGASAAVASVKYRTRTDGEGHVTREAEYKLWSKPAALQMLIRHLGLDHDPDAPPTGSVNVTIDFDELLKRAAEKRSARAIEERIAKVGAQEVIDAPGEE